jgi:hypothetical protein
MNATIPTAKGSYEFYTACLAAGWHREHGDGGYYLYRAGDVWAVQEATHAPLSPAQLNAGEQSEWTLRVLTADAPEVARLLAGKVVREAREELQRKEYEAFRAANPPIPMHAGGLEALLAADRPA